MHLIDALAAGIRGAESGTFEIRKRGTATLATYYTDFEGVSSGATTNPRRALDSNGAFVAYVNELVDVRAYNSAGVLVRSFTSGHSAPAIEVISQSFTGANYVTGQVGANQPTTLQAVLDKVLDSFGTTDFQVLAGSSGVNLSSLASIFSAPLYNVKDPTYGAVGDGSTDDAEAIQAALSAANGANGVVFFPEGVYRINSQLEVYGGTVLLGVESGLSVLEFDQTSVGAVPCIVTLSTGKVVAQNVGFTVTATSAQTAWRFDDGSSTYDPSVHFYRCRFGTASASWATPITHRGTGDFEAVDCLVYFGSGSAGIAASADGGSRVRLFGGRYVSLIAGPEGLLELDNSSGEYTVEALEIDLSAVTGTFHIVRTPGSASLDGGKVTVRDVRIPTAPTSTVTVLRPDGTASGTWLGVIDGVYVEGSSGAEPAVNVATRLDTASTEERCRGVSTVAVTATGSTTLGTRTRVLILDFNANATRTINATTISAFTGSRLTVIGDNLAGVTAAITWGTNFRPVTASPAIGAGDYRVFEFILNGSTWVQVGTSADTV